MMVSFVSCRDEADIPSTGDPINPEKEAAGTYTGEWQVYKGENREHQGDFPGSITITPGEYAYTCSVTLTCDGYANLNGTGVANIVKQSRSYRFYNEVKENGLDAVFSGTIAFDGAAAMSFSKAIKSGRVTTVYYFDFTGAK